MSDQTSLAVAIVSRPMKATVLSRVSLLSSSMPVASASSGAAVAAVMGQLAGMCSSWTKSVQYCCRRSIPSKASTVRSPYLFSVLVSVQKVPKLSHSPSSDLSSLTSLTFTSKLAILGQLSLVSTIVSEHCAEVVPPIEGPASPLSRLWWIRRLLIFRIP